MSQKRSHHDARLDDHNASGTTASNRTNRTNHDEEDEDNHNHNTLNHTLNHTLDDDHSSTESHTMQVCAGCDRAICLACHELEGHDEPALLACQACNSASDGVRSVGSGNGNGGVRSVGSGNGATLPTSGTTTDAFPADPHASPFASSSSSSHAQQQQQQPSQQQQQQQQLYYCWDCRSCCKFCNTRCCPNCAIPCGHCGIVLCPADDKFAVDCWNCHTPYCLVCLASWNSSGGGSGGSSSSGGGTTTPTTGGKGQGSCPQCHAKPSKKMSQLVHLRLKSIYRAFQQQQQHSTSSTTSTSTSSTTTSTRIGAMPATSGEFLAKVHSSLTAAMVNNPVVLNTTATTTPTNETTTTRATDMEASASVVLKRDPQGNWHVQETFQDGTTQQSTLDEWQRRTGGITWHDRGSGSGATTNIHRDGTISTTMNPLPFHLGNSGLQNLLPNLNATLRRDSGGGGGGGGGATSNSNNHTISMTDLHSTDTEIPPTTTRDLEAYAIWKSELKRQEDEADAAAAELLAELEQEEIKEEKKKNKRKGKKKKQAGKEQAAAVVGDGGAATLGGGGGVGESKNVQEVTAKGETRSGRDDENCNHEEQRGSSAEIVEDKKPVPSSPMKEEAPDDLRVLSTSTHVATATGHSPNEEEEQLLCELVADEDQQGLKKFLADLKGVPGKAALRKNAKKALKRMVTAAAAAEESQQAEEEHESPGEIDETYLVEESDGTPLIQVVSRKMNHHPSSTTGHVSLKTTRMSNAGPRAECVLHMSPQLVGWVIGKGGVRIRDLMEDTGTRIWIDQESMGVQEPRVVYISAPKLSMVDNAIHSIRELVETAPGHTTGVSGSASHSKKSEKKAPPASSKHGQKEVVSRPVSEPPTPTTTSTSADKSNKVHEVLTCDSRYVPLLIGRRGWTIKHIQDSTGARVDIDQSVTPRLVTVSGSAEDVRKATRMVRDVLKYPHAQQPSNSDDADPAPPPPQHGKLTQTATLAKHKMPQGSAASEDPEIVHVNFNRDQTRSNTPPPAALIMTGDARSTISATSSLSSTPEPSSVKAQLRHSLSGPVMTDFQRDQYMSSLGDQPIPPPGLVHGHAGFSSYRERHNSSGQIHMSRHLPQAPSLEQRPIGAPGGPPFVRASVSSDLNVYGPPHTTGVGYRAGPDRHDPSIGIGMMPTHLQQSRPTNNAFPNMHGIPSLPQPNASQFPSMHPTSHDQSRIPFQSQPLAPDSLNDSLSAHCNQIHNVAGEYRSAPGCVDPAGGIGLFEPEGSSAYATQHRSMASGSSPPNHPRVPQPETLQFERQFGLGYPHGLSSGVEAQSLAGHSVVHPSTGIGIPVARGRNDASLVDGLFGSSGGIRDGSILGGVRDLSLTNNSASSTGSGHETWGHSIPGWGEESGQPSSGALSQQDANPFPSSGNALPPFLGGPYEQRDHFGGHRRQQQESRFNWS